MFGTRSWRRRARAVAARCARARARVGAACSQNVTDPSLGPCPARPARRRRRRRPRRSRWSPSATPLHRAYRQLTVVDAHGPHGGLLGRAHARPARRRRRRDGCVAAGNLLADEAVPAAMVRGVRADPDGEHLGDRLVRGARGRARRRRRGGAGAVVPGCVVVDAREPGRSPTCASTGRERPDRGARSALDASGSRSRTTTSRGRSTRRARRATACPATCSRRLRR